MLTLQCYFLGGNSFSCKQCHTFSLPSFTKLMIFYRTNWFFIYKDLIIPNFLKKKKTTANPKTKTKQKTTPNRDFFPWLLCLKNTWEHECESVTLSHILALCYAFGIIWFLSAWRVTNNSTDHHDPPFSSHQRNIIQSH